MSTPPLNLTNSAITLYLDDMLGFFGNIMFPTSLLDQLPKKNVKIIQQNKISYQVIKWYVAKMSTPSWKLLKKKRV